MKRPNNTVGPPCRANTASLEDGPEGHDHDETADGEDPACGQHAAGDHETFSGHQQPHKGGGLEGRPQKEEEIAPVSPAADHVHGLLEHGSRPSLSRLMTSAAGARMRQTAACPSVGRAVPGWFFPVLGMASSRARSYVMVPASCQQEVAAPHEVTRASMAHREPAHPHADHRPGENLPPPPCRVP